MRADIIIELSDQSLEISGFSLYSCGTLVVDSILCILGVR
jgi:hypothetical protein